MKKITLISFCLAAFAFASCAGGGCPATGIIPAPQQVTWGEGAFRMPARLLYTTDLDGQDKADLAAWMQRAADGFFPASFVEASDGDMPALELLRTGDGAPESYRLDVSRTKITLTAPDAAGLFYGLQSLAQLAGHHGRRIPAVTIVDAPRFGYRGFMLDVSRHFRDKEFVERQLDLMARYKLNRFHWHLTDGAGWRIEIKKYPALTDIAAWRPYPDWGEWNFGGKRYCHRDDPVAAGGYYTQDDIREVVEYARALHIEVIPEIEMPGHSEEVLAVYPELSCSGKPYTDSDFCIGNEQTFEFLENVLSEVIGLFPSEYIHIGGDEASKRGWRTCPECAARMRREGLKDVDELQSYLVHRIGTFLAARGRRLLGWDEILQGGLAPGATVMSWRGTEGGIAAARAGHRAVMAPSNYCYLDFCQDDPTREPVAAAAFLTLAQAYSYDPAPDSLGADVVPMILGVQGNLWCEHVPTAEHAEHMIWPRLLAIAEVGWSAPERKDFDDFHARVLDAVAWMQPRIARYPALPLDRQAGGLPYALQPEIPGCGRRFADRRVARRVELRRPPLAGVARYGCRTGRRPRGTPACETYRGLFHAGFLCRHLDAPCGRNLGFGRRQALYAPCLGRKRHPVRIQAGLLPRVRLVGPNRGALRTAESPAQRPSRRLDFHRRDYRGVTPPGRIPGMLSRDVPAATMGKGGAKSFRPPGNRVS